MATSNKNFKVKNGLDVNGEITAAAVGGDEGGQLNLAKPQTNTTLSGDVAIDIHQNKLRIFDKSGSNRGAYIDLSAAAVGVGSNLLAGGGGGGATFYVSATEPAGPIVDGSFWFDPTVLESPDLYVFGDEVWIKIAVLDNLGQVETGQLVSTLESIAALADRTDALETDLGTAFNDIDELQDAEITTIDDLSNYFNGYNSRFYPTYKGLPVTLQNPFNLLLTIDGIIQSVGSPDYVWQSVMPRVGFRIDNDGYIAFPEAIPVGSTFDARVLVGSSITTQTKVYPFKAMDIVLGGY